MCFFTFVSFSGQTHKKNNAAQSIAFPASVFLTFRQSSFPFIAGILYIRMYLFLSIDKTILKTTVNLYVCPEIFTRTIVNLKKVLYLLSNVQT